MRSVIYVLGGAPATDERNFKRLRASRAELEPGIQLADFKHLMREQFFILKQDREAALESLPTLLKGQTADQIDAHLAHIEHVLAASGELSEHAADRFERIKGLFHQAIERAPQVEQDALRDAQARVASEARAGEAARREVESLMESLPAAEPAPASEQAAPLEGGAEAPTAEEPSPAAPAEEPASEPVAEAAPREAASEAVAEAPAESPSDEASTAGSEAASAADAEVDASGTSPEVQGTSPGTKATAKRKPASRAAPRRRTPRKPRKG